MKRDKIKQIAVQMAGESGLINLSRAGLCERAGIPVGSFTRIMGCTFTDFVDELRALETYSPFADVTKSRTDPALRKEQILNAAVMAAQEHGFHNVTRELVASAAGVSGGLVGRHFNMDELSNAIMEQAVKLEVLSIIAQGIATRHPAASNLSSKLFSKVMRSLTA